MFVRHDIARENGPTVRTLDENMFADKHSNTQRLMLTQNGPYMRWEAMASMEKRSTRNSNNGHVRSNAVMVDWLSTKGEITRAQKFRRLERENLNNSSLDIFGVDVKVLMVEG